MKKRNYTKEDVTKLQGSLKIEYTLAKRGATKLRERAGCAAQSIQIRR